LTAPNRNTVWARVLVDELARSGLTHAVVAPGSRSTPVVLALARHPEVQTHVALDERSGAFLALGLGRRTRQPAAIVTTSGTAGANLHPAVLEANQAQVPLLAITADRPHELRGTDANQTVDQVGLFGDAVREAHDLSQPKLEPRALRNLRARADRALHQARDPPAGPVHLNLPFAKPLEPTEVPGDVPQDLADRAPLGYEGRPEGRPFTDFPRTRTTPDAGLVDEFGHRLAQADRGLIVTGPNPEPERVGPAAIELAHASGFPVLADPTSGARFAPGAPEAAVPGYDLVLRSERLADELAPDLVLRVGRDPTSKHATAYLERHADVEQIVVDDGPIHKDHRGLAGRYLEADPAATLQRLGQDVDRVADKDWRARWQDAGRRALQAAQREHQRAPFEGTILREAARAVPPEGGLFVSNSMPIRDLDTFAPPRDDTVHAYANRGASGIDGVTSTAIGVARTHEQPTLAVLGDLAFIHDCNGLQLVDEEDDVVFLVVNNDGGGIFHMLPIRDHEHFDPYFTTPHGLDVGSVADAHGLDHRTTEAAGVRQALGDALSDPRGQVIEVPTDRETNLERHQAVEDRVLDEIDGGDEP
jgi:2-succinyl-5-enolpyruvyl-6-hydroxy-3-cyclohexene-1-carboxylate synthase